MKKQSTATHGTASLQTVKLLVATAGSDTVYADVYLRRARELLATVLPLEQYNGLKRVQRETDAALKQLKIATASQDWARVESLAEQVDGLRRSAEENAEARALGISVYDARDVSIDPFSPGLESLRGSNQDLAARRDELVADLKALATDDGQLGAFYGSRGAFFAGLALTGRISGTAPAAGKSSAEVQQLAMQAVQDGDMSQLRLYAQQLSARKAMAGSSASKPGTPGGATEPAAYQCPVDLAAQLPDAVPARAQTFGLVVARAEPPPQSAPLYDYVATRIWQPTITDTETEREGTVRAQAMVDASGFPPEMSGPLMELVGQFLHNGFINSGGARYIPPFSAETVLVEDFPEATEPPATGELLSALGLTRRRALARQAIDAALLEHGAEVLQKLLLDPAEFRLVCIPHDLYIGLGRDRGWGQQQQWTHFDGFRVFNNGKLRALVGGSARYGGLSDLISIATNDEREEVIARFAVIRRARQVARWH